MNIPDPLNGFMLCHEDFAGSYSRLDEPTRKFIVEITGCMILRNGRQSDGTWGAVRLNSDQLRDALAFVALCING